MIGAFYMILILVKLRNGLNQKAQTQSWKLVDIYTSFYSLKYLHPSTK
jgi:hypothetical protein